MEKTSLPARSASSSAQRHIVISWVLLVAGIALSITLSIGVHRQVEQEARFKFEESSRDILHRVRSEVAAYEEVLVGLSAFVSSKDDVTRAEFRRYVEGLDLRRRFPGFDNLNYAQRVSPSELRAFEQAVKRDTSLHPAGYPSFAVTPHFSPAQASSQADYHVIKYFEPWERSPQAFGKNIAAVPGVPATLERMRNSGQIVTSGRAIRIEGADRRVGLAMRMAVYQAGAVLDTPQARSVAFSGSVGAGYRIADIVRSVVPHQQLGDMTFRLVDLGLDGKAQTPESDRLLFDSEELTAGARNIERPLQHVGSFPVGGRIWQMTFSAPASLSGTVSGAAPWLMLAGGLAGSLLLFGLFRSFATSRRAAEALAHAMRHDLSESRKLEARRKELEMVVAQIFAHGRATTETMNEVAEALRQEGGFEAAQYHVDGPGSAGALALPLTAEGNELGMIELHGKAPTADADLLKVLQSVAAQAAQYLLRRRAEDNFKYLATHDALTGLPNRLLFGERVSQAIARAERAKQGLAVLLLDLDRFKNVNDTLGHGAGDAVLKACAERVGRALRDSDLVARISGDEFAILVEPCLQPAAAIAVARKILNAIERPLIVQGQEIVLTGSVGISMFHEDGRDAETLLKHADIAMFRAKENGRNNYQFYSSQMNPHSLERLGLETALRRALERNEFFLHYQPKVDTRSGEITGVEALLRWKHADLGMISPAQFIPIAEETGLIEPIGAWVLKEACAQAARWQAQGLGVRVAVNLSARQFRNQRLARDVRKCLSDAALDPRLLELELTESMVMQNPEDTAAMLRELKAMGIVLSIDDFGTGYSSLAYLKRFPIDAVKIDRSFVKDIPGDAEDVAIVEAVLALAQSMRLKVVAEGVETEEQHKHLRKLGCDELQGYLISKPLPADDATRFLEKSFAQAPRSKHSLAAVA
jgi:diguanylate cyclase (GGDEF)-like protein